MSLNRSRQVRKDNYVALEDIQKLIYDSDEENSNGVLHDEQAGTRETYGGNSLKPGLGSGSERKSSKYHKRPYDSLDIQYGKPAGKKLNSSSSEIEGEKFRSSIFSSNTERKRESSIDFRNTKYNLRNTFSRLNKTESSSKGCFLSNGHSEHVKLVNKEKKASHSFQSPGRKRILDQEQANINFTKKFKKEIDRNMSDAPGYNSLQVELEVESNIQDENDKKKNLESIVNELELLRRKLKERVVNYGLPISWGMPITRQCNDKWDTHYIPQMVVNRYEKHVEVSPSSSSSFRSKNFETVTEGCDSRENQIQTREKGSRNPDKGVEEGCEIECCNEPLSDIQMDEIFTRFNEEIQGVASLKSRNHNRQQEERVSNNSANDGYVIEKIPKKLSSKSNRGKKGNKRTLIEPEISSDPTSKYQNEDNIDSNKNFEKYKAEDLDSRITSPTSIETHSEEKAISLGTGQIIEEKQVVCPICNNKFDIEKIVTHASHCATETYRD